MKKLFFLIFGITTFIFFSCKKNYNCECGKTHNSHDLGHVYARTRIAAKKQCEKNNASLPDTMKCVLQ